MFKNAFLKAAVALFLLTALGKSAYSQTEENFIINYDIRYDVQSSGETFVTQNTIITSLKNNVVPTTYSFKTKYMDIYDIIAQTNGKKAEVRKENPSKDETTVIVPFSTYSIGEGKQNIVNLTYKTKGIASKVGDVWNIYIQGIDAPETTTIYNIVLSVPDSMGPKIFVSPNPATEKYEDGKRVYTFVKENYPSKGITAAFGKYQSLNFRIKYQLENNRIIGSVYEVALPPDIINIQQVKYENITPRPRKIRLDGDGNALALFWVGPRSKLEITLTGSAKILGRQINTDLGGKIENLPKSLVKEYAKNQKYWESKNEEIKSFADSLFDPELNVSQNAKRVYDYITSNLTYDTSAAENTTVERKGAVAALTQRGSFTCMEFSDLFVGTLRAMGIPSREIEGYAFTNDNIEKPISISLKGGDTLHSWAEYYDPFYGWVQVDPTWGTTSGTDYFTKLDTNHFAFVIKGKSSEYPYPAGAYRYSDNEKLVDIDFAATSKNDSDATPQITIKKALNFNPIKLIQGQTRYIIDNTSGYFIYDLQGKILAPSQKASIYLEKNADQFAVKDFSGKSYTIKVR
ncbi:MAG: hypothetical protein KatS3mg101_0736 [Patescibacteria group bacterium]|nr:MAG: hypothetical protein KatS3mg101_0736 [Patescibacteria group bacterium]